MFQAVYGQTDPFPNLDFEIYQNDNFLPDNLLYDHDPNFSAVTASENQLATKKTIKIDGQNWVIVIATKEGTGLTKSQEALPKIVLAGGLIFSLLTFLLFFKTLKRRSEPST